MIISLGVSSLNWSFSNVTLLPLQRWDIVFTPLNLLDLDTVLTNRISGSDAGPVLGLVSSLAALLPMSGSHSPCKKSNSPVATLPWEAQVMRSPSSDYGEWESLGRKIHTRARTHTHTHTHTHEQVWERGQGSLRCQNMSDGDVLTVVPPNVATSADTVRFRDRTISQVFP